MEQERELITLDELTDRVGISVRNVRFYTSKGLVPPPIRRGRSGYYTPDHVARLELVQELQSHGFTLAAIERYLSRLPEAATPEDIALHRTMLTPWQQESSEELTRAQLERRAGRPLSDEDLETLSALGIVMRNKRGRFQVVFSQLTVGLGLLDLGFPTEAAVAAIDHALTAHELIKVKIGEGEREERAAISTAMAARTGAAVVQGVGRIVVLWRPRPDEAPTR